MVDLGLQSNEGILLQGDGVLESGRKSGQSGQLVLTNFHLIYVSRGLFRKVKAIKKYPVKQIKVIEGQAQVFLTRKAGSGALQLQLHFYEGPESFELQGWGKKQITRWVNRISELLTGNPVPPEALEDALALPGAQMVAEVLKDTVNVFRASFGLEPKKEPAPESAAGRCEGCHAPLKGFKGQLVRCPYCGNDQLL